MSTRPTFPIRAPEAQPGPRALEGIRIVDFSRVMAGPFASQVLGDFGAEVIKIEHPRGGDDTRYQLPQPAIGDQSHFFLALNRNKKSVAIDFNTPEGYQVVLDLIATADVVLENFTTRVMKRAGLDYDSLKERFPQLIYCSVSAYGRTGRLANVAGYDSAISQEAGVAQLGALEGERPVLGGLPTIDLTTAMNAAIGILVALQARARHGFGQFVETALYDTAIADLNWRGYHYLASGKEPEAMGRAPKMGMPGGEFDCSDGIIWFTCALEKMFAPFCRDVIERPELIDDPRFRTLADRKANTPAMIDTIEPIFRQNTRAFWAARLQAAGVPCGQVRTVGEALSSDLTAERDMVFEVPHPTVGSVPMIGQPIRMSRTPSVYPVAPALLGADTVEVLSQLPGYDADKIDLLLKGGAVASTAGSGDVG